MIGRFTVVEAPEDREGSAQRATAIAEALAAADGVLCAKGWMGFPFREVPDGPPDLRLAAVSAIGADRDALGAAWEELVAPLQGQARYDLEGEVVRAAGTGWGAEVPTDGARPLAHEEPVLVVISGDLHPQHVGAFVEAGGPVVAQANQDPDYLGGCGLLSAKMLDITSFSCWASARASRRFAFGAGAHRTARDADEQEGWHDRSTNFFATLRVLGASGTLLGTSPFV